MRNIFSWNYFGLKISVLSDTVLFSELIKNKFNIFNKKKTYQFEKRNILLSFSSKKYKEVEAHQKKISSNASISKNSLVIKHNYLTTITTVKTIFVGKNIKEIQIYFSSSFLFELVNVFTNNQMKHQLFQNIIKQYVEQSFLWNLCTKNNLNCLHASSIEENEKVTIFAGLNGVGKSTLALWLVNKKRKLFSDNYLLVKGKYAYLFPDTIRLTKSSLELLKIEKLALFGFNKYLVKNNNTFFSKKTKADIKSIYIVDQSEKWKKETLAEKKALNKIKNLQISNNEEVLYAPVSQFFNEKNVTFNIKAKFYELTIANLENMPYEF